MMSSSGAQASSCSLLLSSTFHRALPVDLCRIHPHATEAVNDLAPLTNPFHQLSTKVDLHCVHLPYLQSLLRFMLTEVNMRGPSTAISTHVQTVRLWVAQVVCCQLRESRITLVFYVCAPILEASVLSDEYLVTPFSCFPHFLLTLLFKIATTDSAKVLFISLGRLLHSPWRKHICEMVGMIILLSIISMIINQKYILN